MNDKYSGTKTGEEEKQKRKGRQLNNRKKGDY